MEKINSAYAYGWVKKAFILTVIGLVLLIVLSIFYQYDLRGVEKNVIYSIQLALENNELLYQSPESPPFNITQYSPLYYIISDAVISLLSIDSDDYFKIRIVTRIISVFLLILSLWVIKDTLQKAIGIKQNSSLLLMLVYLIISFPWFNISRPDVLILLFFSLSIRSIFLWQKNRSNINNAIFLGVFIALGILSKLTMGIYIISFGLYMIIAKEWRLAFFSAISSILSLIISCLIIHKTGYDLTFLYENIFEGIDNGTSIYHAAKKAYKNYFLYFGLFSLFFLLFSVVYLRNWKLVKTNQKLLFLITISYSVGVMSFLSALKIGSALNYFNELLLCLMLFILSFLENYDVIKKKLCLIAFMLFGISIAINHTFLYAPRLVDNLAHLTSINNKEGDNPKIKNFLNSNLGKSYFYSYNRRIALSYPQRCVLFPSDIHYLTYEREVFNYSYFKEWAKENLRFVIVHPNTTELYGLDLKENYSLKIRYNNHYLYELNAYNN